MTATPSQTTPSTTHPRHNALTGGMYRTRAREVTPAQARGMAIRRPGHGQQQHGSSASTQPGSPGFFASMMGAAASHAMQHAGSHGNPQHGHAPVAVGCRCEPSHALCAIAERACGVARRRAFDDGRRGGPSHAVCTVSTEPPGACAVARVWHSHTRRGGSRTHRTYFGICTFHGDARAAKIRRRHGPAG